MGFWQELWQKRDDHNKLAQLRYTFSKAFADDEYGDIEYYSDLIDQLETRIRVRDAWRYGVPVPDKPKKNQDSNDWVWRFSFGDHVLTVGAHARLRREIAFEKEIAQKPWLSWGALIVSIVSLILSFGVAIFR